jgi:hypothetical protein
MHALIETDTLTDRGNRKDFGGDTPPDLSHKNPSLKWVTYTEQAKPSFDPWIERIEKSTEITATDVTLSYNVVALTAEEQDARLGDYYETSTGIKLKTDEASQAAFTSLITLLNESGAPPEHQVTVKDVKGDAHTIDLATLRTDLVAYGTHCYTQFLA